MFFDGVNCAETTFLVLGYCAHRNQCDLVYAPRCALWLHLFGQHRCLILYSLLSWYSRDTRICLDLDDLLGDHHHSAWDPSWLGFVARRCSTEHEMKRLSTWVSYTGGGIAILSILAAYFFTPSKTPTRIPSLSGFHVEPTSAGVASTGNGDQGINRNRRKADVQQTVRKSPFNHPEWSSISRKPSNLEWTKRRFIAKALRFSSSSNCSSTFGNGSSKLDQISGPWLNSPSVKMH